MVWVPGGRFPMGTDTGLPNEAPAREVEVAGFWLDATEVTNDAFARFVEATGYVTEAERLGDAVVFVGPVGTSGRREWELVKGASWKHPEGPSSDLEGRGKHPVVHVSYRDALAYAQWARKRLPTEEEWERAARGGAEERLFAWGDELVPNGGYPANTWQGRFPFDDSGADGFVGRAPVASYPPNEYGVFDLGGNVWEWTSEPSASGAGPDVALEPDTGAPHVIRGGSFLCARNSCQGYRVETRQWKQEADADSNLGFRCAADP